MRDPSKMTFGRILKLAISALVAVYSFFQNALARIIAGKKAGRCVVIYYHSIPHSQRHLFARQLDLLKEISTPISAESQEALDAGQRYTAVTFDDGFEDFLQNALPELEARKIPSTVFIITEALGKLFGPPGHGERVMTPDQVNRLPKGIVALGSHTLTHPNLKEIPPESARREIFESKKELERILGQPVKTISFPFGSFTDHCVDYCREAGYSRVFTTLPEFTYLHPLNFLIGRVRVDPTDWRIEYRLKLLGAYRWLPWAIRLKRRILSHSLVRAFQKNTPAAATSAYSVSVIQEVSQN